MSNKEIIKRLKHNGLDKYGSWAVYGEKAMTDASNHDIVHIKDIRFPRNLSRDELAHDIQSQYMFVALNVAGKDYKKKKRRKKKDAQTKESWDNYHYTGKRSKDVNIPKIIVDTDYLGAYMTDIIKAKMDSEKVLDRMTRPNRSKKNIDILKFSIHKFQRELDIVKPKKIIIFGKKAFEIFKMAVHEGLLNVSNDVYVVEINHYSEPYVTDDKMYTRLIHIEKDKGEHDENKWNTIDGVKDMPNRDGYKLSWK